MKHAFAALALSCSFSLGLASFGADAGADAPHVVEHARLVVGDVVPGTSPAVAAVDLGPAPPPGGTRLVGHEDVERAIRMAGLTTDGLRIPTSIRVTGASRKISISELSALARPAVESALSQGVTLMRVDATYEVTVAPNAVVKRATLPRTPHQKGSFRTTAIVELACDDVVVARVPVQVTLDVSEQAARADVLRGSRVNVNLDSPGIRVSTAGVVQSDVNVGETAAAQLPATGKMVRVRLLSRDEAQIVDGT